MPPRSVIERSTSTDFLLPWVLFLLNRGIRFLCALWRGGLLFIGPEVVGIHIHVCRPFFGKIFHGEDRRDGANGYARATVDTLDGVNINHFLLLEISFVLFGMDTI